MKQPPKPLEDHTKATEATGHLLPSWAMVAVVMFALLVMLGYASPDMRAVYVAAWAACF